MKPLKMPNIPSVVLPTLLFLIFSLLFPFPCLAAEEIIIFSPKGLQFAGAPILFHIQARNVVSPEAAAVYYRARGITIFRRLPMKRETAIDFRAFLKAQKVVPPGIEYFFVLKDKAGHTFTFPRLDPRKKPYSLKIDLDKQPPHLVKTLPANGASLHETRPVIEISFLDEETKVDTRSVRISLDRTDVTQLATITDTTLTYHPPADLGHGKHTVAVEMRDICGNHMEPRTWDFTIPRTAHLQKAGVDIQWDGEFRRMVARDKNNQEPAWHLQSSATLKSRLESGPFKTSLDANAWYTDEEGPGPQGDNFNLNNYLYTAQYGRQSMALGDVTVEGTELISQSIARRGGVAKVDLGATKAQGFVLRSNAVTGFDHLIGADDPDQRLVGASLSQEIIKDKGLTVKGTYITGRNHEPDNYNTSTLEAGTEGDIYSIGLSSDLFKGRLKLDGEFSGSSYDSDVSDDLGKVRDKAWLAKASGRGKFYDWEAGYKYLGPGFQTIVNATGASNRAEYHAGFGWRALSSIFRLTAIRAVDNVDEDPLMPVIRNTTGAFTYNLAKPRWPAFFFNYTRNNQDSSNEPQGYSPIKNQAQTVGGGFSLAGSRWSIAPAYTFTTFDDKSGTMDNDSQTHVAILSGSFRPTDTFAINPSVSYTNMHTDVTDLTTETYQGTLGTVLSLYDRMVDLNGTLSYLDNRTDDDSSHTSTFNGIAQVNWHLEKLFFGKGKQTFSLRAQYSRTEDHVNDSITRDYTVFAVFSFSVPVKVY